MLLNKLSQQFSNCLNYVYRLFFRRRLYQHSQTLTVNTKPAIIFAPHQDDEILGCGGLMALKQKQGVPVWVVFTTNGEGCYPDFVPISPEECVKIRQQEALQALDIIGVDSTKVFFLNHPDSSLASLQEQKRREVVEELQDLLLTLKPQEVYVPYRYDAHSDHILTHDLVKEAVQTADLQVDFWQYPIWSIWYMDEQNGPVASELTTLHRLPIKSVQKQKVLALKQYRSQYKRVAKRFKVLPSGFLTFFSSPYELFVKEPLGISYPLKSQIPVQR